MKTIEKIANELQGTRLSLKVVLLHHKMKDFEHDIKFCMELDKFVFDCDNCGVWFKTEETGERSDDRWVCKAC